MKRAILAIGVHAGDIEARCAGMLAKYLDAGYDVHYVVLTNSNSGLYVTKNGQEKWRYSEEMVQIRRAQIEASTAILGVKPIFLDFKESVYTTRKGRQIYPDIREMDFGNDEPTGREALASLFPHDQKAVKGAFAVRQKVAELFSQFEPHLTIIQEPDFTVDHHVGFNHMYYGLNSLFDTGPSKLLASTMYPLPVRSLQRKGNIHFDVSKYMDVVEKTIQCFRAPLSKCAGTVAQNLRVRKKVARERGFAHGGESFYQLHGPPLSS